MHSDPRRELNARAPVMRFGTDARVRLADDRVIAERCHNAGRMHRMEAAQCWHIKVVVMIVRNEHHIDRWEFLKRNARRINAFWTSKTNR